MKRLFYGLFVIGVIIISILAFTIPSNPNMNIPSVSMWGFDKPLWACIIILGVFFYGILLMCIYDKIKKGD